MSKAIGMVEYKTVSTGMTAADNMVKTSNVEILQAATVCPGKYIVIITGELSAVRSSVDSAKALYPGQLTDSFVLGNPHEDIFKAIYGGANIEGVKALGVLETFTAPSIIVAADTAAKAADVKLIELRIARGMCGKSYMLLTGTVASVTAAIENAMKVVGENGMLSLLTEVSSRGDWPRDVQFSPDGKYLVCANQQSNSLTAFEIVDGRLEYRSELRIPAPACVAFAKIHQEV